MSLDFDVDAFSERILRPKGIQRAAVPSFPKPELRGLQRRFYDMPLELEGEIASILVYYRSATTGICTTRSPRLYALGLDEAHSIIDWDKRNSKNTSLSRLEQESIEAGKQLYQQHHVPVIVTSQMRGYKRNTAYVIMNGTSEIRVQQYQEGELEKTYSLPGLLHVLSAEESRQAF